MSLVFMKRPCMAPSIRSPENNSLSASVRIPTHRCVRGHMEPPPVSDCRPTGAEPDLAGTRPTCSPEWTENTEGTADPQEEVPRGAEATGVFRCTRLAPWGAVRGPKAGWHSCRALLNLHLETRQLGSQTRKRGWVTHTYVPGGRESVLQVQDWCPQVMGRYSSHHSEPTTISGQRKWEDEGLVAH